MPRPGPRSRCCARAARGMVLDEGGAVAGEAFPGITAPVGVVGVTEKGLTNIALTVTGGGGHAQFERHRGRLPL